MNVVSNTKIHKFPVIGLYACSNSLQVTPEDKPKPNSKPIVKNSQNNPETK